MIIHPDDILLLKAALWPQVRMYDKQVQIIESTFTCPETYVPAGNKLGKDFVAGFIALSAFLVCQVRNITCRIITTSVAEHHLKVLWGEIGRFLVTSKEPLIPQRGKGLGAYLLTVNYQELRRAEEARSKNPINYLAGRVSAKGEGLAGHHAQFTLIIGDESSGLDDEVYKMAQGWAKHMLFLGNPNPCENWWKAACQAGDVIRAPKVETNGRVA